MYGYGSGGFYEVGGVGGVHSGSGHDGDSSVGLVYYLTYQRTSLDGVLGESRREEAVASEAYYVFKAAHGVETKVEGAMECDVDIPTRSLACSGDKGLARRNVHVSIGSQSPYHYA